MALGKQAKDHLIIFPVSIMISQPDGNSTLCNLTSNRQNLSLGQIIKNILLGRSLKVTWQYLQNNILERHSKSKELKLCKHMKNWKATAH